MTRYIICFTCEDHDTNSGMEVRSKIVIFKCERLGFDKVFESTVRIRIRFCKSSRSHLKVNFKSGGSNFGEQMSYKDKKQWAKLMIQADNLIIMLCKALEQILNKN